MAMKENDWILDGIVNPDKNLDDFLISGYNTSNTQLLSKDDYKKIQQFNKRLPKMEFLMM